MWAIHAGHDHGQEEDHNHAHEHDDHAHQEFVDETAELLSTPEGEITSVLLTFKNHNHQTLNMMRSINENSTIQAAHPAWELSRLYSMVGAGTKMLTWLAWIIGLVSVISIFLSLLQSLRARKYELAVLRVLGARPRDISMLIILEGLFQALVGFCTGLILAHIGLYLVDTLVEDAYRYNIQAWRLGDIEMVVVCISLAQGVIAASWPAWLAYRTDVSKTLQT